MNRLSVRGVATYSLACFECYFWPTYYHWMPKVCWIHSFYFFILLSSVWKLKTGQKRQWLSMIHLRPIPSRMQRTLLCIPAIYLKGCAFPESSPLKINTDLSVKHPCGHSACRVYFPRAHITFQWSFKVWGPHWIRFSSQGSWLLGFWNHTSLTGPAKIACSGTIADISVPPIPAHAVVFAGVAKARFCCFSWAGGLHASSTLNFSHLPDIFALAINEQISYAAHIAVVEQRSPHLGGEDEASFIFWQASQVQLIIQVQNLTLARSGVRRAQRVDRNGTWCKDKRAHGSLQKATSSEHHPFFLPSAWGWTPWGQTFLIFLPIPGVLPREMNTNLRNQGTWRIRHTVIKMVVISLWEWKPKYTGKKDFCQPPRI